MSHQKHADCGTTMPIFVNSENLMHLVRTNTVQANEICSSLIKNSSHTLNRYPLYKPGNIKIMIPLQRDKFEAGFMRSIFEQLCYRLGTFSEFTPLYYSLMSEKYYNCLSARPGCNLKIYRNVSVLYNSIFKIDKIESFDLSTSFGLNLRQVQRAQRISLENEPQVHLVRFEPKMEVVKSMSSQALLEYRFFVSQLMFSRRAFMIPSIKKLFDIEDRYIIRELRLNEHHRTGDLSFEQYLRIFHLLRQHPNYNDSLFIQAAIQGERDFAPSDDIEE